VLPHGAKEARELPPHSDYALDAGDIVYLLEEQ